MCFSPEVCVLINPTSNGIRYSLIEWRGGGCKIGHVSVLTFLLDKSYHFCPLFIKQYLSLLYIGSIKQGYLRTQYRDRRFIYIQMPLYNPSISIKHRHFSLNFASHAPPPPILLGLNGILRRHKVTFPPWENPVHAPLTYRGRIKNIVETNYFFQTFSMWHLWMEKVWKK